MTVIPSNKPLILVTGATGYVGGRLLKELEKRYYPVRCLARKPEYLLKKAAPRTEIVRGDLQDVQSLTDAMKGVHTVFYLVHAMGFSGDFEQEEEKEARNFTQAAISCGVQRIIYLGGLGHGSDLSPHLSSRQNVGKILRMSGIPVIEFQASIILGSGSLSFEMIRALVERLPVMITPRWVSRLAQPISIEDILEYLIEAIEIPLEKSEIFEIGGPVKVSYLDLMKEYARQKNLKRIMISVPVLTPRLSSLWLGLVTPVYARVGRKLIESIRHDTVVERPVAPGLFSVKPRSVREAIERALKHEDEEFSKTHWADAVSSSGSGPRDSNFSTGSKFIENYQIRSPMPSSKVFSVISQIGGKNGWYFASGLWKLRGFIDLLFGGPGLKRGRKNLNTLLPGDILDWWRVEAIENGRFLRLFAEMKLPGRAWLEFEVKPEDRGCLIFQTAIFEPCGLPGLLYWYALYPVHKIIFKGLLRAIVRRSAKNYPPSSV